MAFSLVGGVVGSVGVPASLPAVADQRVVVQGIAVEFSVRPLTEPPSADPVAGRDVEIRFRITDTTSDMPLTGLRPSVWLDLRLAGETTDEARCRDKIQSFLQETLRVRPTLDLNTYYVVTLNDDFTVSVLDPLLAFGGSRLFALVRLKGPGEDWALRPDQRKLYVTVPAVRQVAVLDTATWRVETYVDVGSHPGRLALQPDGRRLWVGDDVDTGTGGVVIIDTATHTVVARIPTGPGRHEMAFTEDARYAFVTNERAGTLSVIDVAGLEKVRDVPVGPAPVAVAYSPLSRSAYVVHADGFVTVVDGDHPGVRTRRKIQPGLSGVFVAPGGRWALIPNPRADRVYVLDTTDQRVAQVLQVPGAPYQVAFTTTHAYIRSRRIELVHVVALRDLEKRPARVTYFPAGQRPPASAVRSSRADTIVPAPEPNAVLIASPADKLVYYYMEGMPAPMGSFSDGPREPLAVLVVDRGLRETAPGLYTSVARMPSDGVYDVAFLLSTPRVVHCFELAVRPDPDTRSERAETLSIDLLTESRRIPVRADVSLQFRVTDPTSREPLAGLDLWVLAFNPAGWHYRAPARSIGEGRYEVVLRVPEPGVYYLFFLCPSRGLRPPHLPHFILLAEAAPPSQ